MRDWSDISWIADVLGCFAGRGLPSADGLLVLHRGTSDCCLVEAECPEII